ncbi:MAG: hypothetical protein WCK17_01410 [Verrucomicrobiota bacterium]
MNARDLVGDAAAVPPSRRAGRPERTVAPLTGTLVYGLLDAGGWRQSSARIQIARDHKGDLRKQMKIFAIYKDLNMSG